MISGTRRILRRMLAMVLGICMVFSCVGPALAAEPDDAVVDEINALLSQGHDLAGLEEIMPLSLVPDGKVGAEYFYFYLVKAGGHNYLFSNLDTMQDAEFELDSGEDWDGVLSGEQKAEDYPAVKGFDFDGLTVDGMEIHGLGLLEVNGERYIYVTAREDGETGPMTSIVLSDKQKIYVNYDATEYKINYEVCVDGVKQSEEDDVFGLDSVFGIHRAEMTSEQSYSVNVVIPAGYTGHVYLGDTSDFDSDIEKLERYPQDTGYGNYPLGQDVEWEKTNYGAGIKANSGTAPGYFSLSGTYSSGEPESADAPQTCRVELKQQPSSEHTFDPALWIESREVTRPGESNSRVENSQTKSVQNPDGSVDFTWSFTSSPVSKTYFELRAMSINNMNLNIPYIVNGHTSDTASAETKLPSGATVKITVRLNSGDSYKRDYTVEITGALRDMVVTSGSLNASADYYREVVISRLYGTDLQMWYIEAGTPGSDYKWRDVVQSTSLRVGEKTQSADNNPYNFDYAQWGTSDNYQYKGNIRFRLHDGYGWAGGNIYGADSAGNSNVQFREKTGKYTQKFSQSGGTEIEGPDAEGWYYTTLTNDVGVIGLLTIEAVPIQYRVRYQDGLTSGAALNPILANASSGRKTVRDMPAFLAGADGDTQTGDHTDTNRGSYYSEASSSSYSSSLGSDQITTSGTVPSTTVRQGGYARSADHFVRSSQGGLMYASNQKDYKIIHPTDTVALESLVPAAQELEAENQAYIIYFTALWSTPTPAFSYYVTFNYTDAGGIEHPYAQSGTDPNAEDDDIYFTKNGKSCAAVARQDTFFTTRQRGASVVFHDPQNQAVKAWLTDHPWQKYDLTKNGSQGFEGDYFWKDVQNNGEVDVWFTTSLGRLTVTKEVAGLNDVFTFDISFRLPTEDDEETAGDETEFFGEGAPYGVSYTDSGGERSRRIVLTYYAGSGLYSGEFTLSGGESAVFDLPKGTKATVTERAMEGYSTEITARDGDTDSEWTGSWSDVIDSAAAPGPTVTFKNTGTGVLIEKFAKHYYCAPTKETVEAAGGDPITYTVRIRNTAPTPVAGPVTVTDTLPADLTVDEASINEGGIWDEDSHTLTWTFDGLEDANVKDLSFGVTLPIVEETTDFENHAAITYEDTRPLTSNTVKVTAHPFWLRIAKVVEGGGADKEEMFTFHIDLTAPDGKTLQDTYPYAYDTGDDLDVHTAAVQDKSSDSRSGFVEIRLHHAQSVMIYGLPEGTDYTVTEKDSDGYSPSLDMGSATGKISNERDEVVFKNFKGAPEIILTKTVNGMETVDAEIGDVLTYTISAVNIGDAAATDLVITDVIPEGLKLVEGSVTGGTESGGTVTWEIGSLDMGEEHRAEVSFQVEIPNITESAGWKNAASAEAGGREFASNETAVTFTAEPALSATKTPVSMAPQGGYTTGDIIRWEITVSNSGNVDINCPIYVADELAKTPEAFIALSGLAMGESATLTVEYAVTDADRYAGQVTNSVFVSTIRARAVEATAESTVEDLAPVPPPSGVDQWLDAKNHDVYLHGYPDGRFGPDDPMTRAEAAQMFYNLLLDQSVPDGIQFDDVDEDSWYAPAVDALSAMGIIVGYGDGRFGPNDTLTRAQLVAMAMRFSKGEEGTCDFPDVPDTHWAYRYIAGAVRYGWIKGYSDGAFGPDDPLTRAQATAIVNRMLGREADMSFISKHLKDMKTYQDLLPEHWAYGDILEASNGHRYAIRNGAETWARLQ